MGEHFYAPVAGETVRNDTTNADGGADVGGFVNGRWQPGGRTRRASLHDVRLRPSAVQEEAPSPPVEIPQHYTPTYDQQQVGYTQPENYMASNHHSEMPDLDEDFDPYDREQMGVFIQKQVQAALAPSRQAQNDAEIVGQYNRAVAKYGDDGNFKSTMNEALEMCVADAKAGKPVDIEQAYEAASESNSRRPGQRLSHLPSKAKTIKGLGELLAFNHRTGRAKPYRGR